MYSPMYIPYVYTLCIALCIYPMYSPMYIPYVYTLCIALCIYPTGHVINVLTLKELMTVELIPEQEMTNGTQ